MFELSSETRIVELAAESPAMMKALMATGIFRAGDDPNIAIDDLCLNFGLHPSILLDTLARAREAEVPSDVDVSELNSMTLTDVVANIETLHHAYLRETLPVIGELVDKVVGVHGADDVRLAKIQALLAILSTDLENHMLHEEEALFPMVRDMEAAGAVRPTRCGDKVGGPIACMENEHNIARTELTKLRELTENYSVPKNACMTYRRMLDELAGFDRNMVIHMYKEDEVLFPRAVEAQAALRKAGAAPSQSAAG